MEDAVSGAEIASHLPSGSGCCPPASLPLAGWGWAEWEGPAGSQLALLWYLLGPLFCEQAGCALGQGFSWESALSPSFFLCACLSPSIPEFGLLSHVSSLRLFSGHSGPVLTLSMYPHFPVQPPLAAGQHGRLGYFSAGSCR